MATVVPSMASPPLPSYTQVKETSHDLDWADLIALDLSTFDRPGGKKALAAQLFDALQTIGFFCIVNFGLTQEEVDRQFAIGNAFFELPTQEKLKYRADLEHGGYVGYKPQGVREIYPGVFDNFEIYNIPKFIPQLQRSHPDLINANKPEIEHFSRHIYDHIVKKLLILFAIVLELPEDHFVQCHRYEAVSDCHLRYMKYHARDADTNAKIGNVWLKGHTDYGSLTLLFRQPVAALQVRGPDGSWKWVKPHDGGITVNAADALQFVTRGFLKSSIHRVVAPPPDQADQDRLGVLYFVRPESDLKLKSVDSPLLERLGYSADEDAELAAGVTAGEWVKARVKAGVSNSGQAGGDTEEQEIVKGLKTKYYD